MSRTSDFVGQGIGFPLAFDQTGALAWSSGQAALDQSIRAVISTAPGERVMRSEFGCAIWDLLFSPITPNTLGLMADAVRDAIGRWEPRVELEDVTVTADPERDGTVLIDITYRRRDTNDRRNLVHPFYVIPRDEAPS